MAFDEALRGRVRAVLAGEQNVSERRMFGGVCFTADGAMACGIVGSELVVRVGPSRYEAALRARHARPRDFTGRPLRGFVYVAQAGCRNQHSLKRWVLLGLEYARDCASRKDQLQTPATS